MTQSNERTSSKAKASNRSGPTGLVQAIITLLVTIAGSQVFTLWAPPTGNTGIIRLMLVGEAAVAWLIGLMLSTRWTKRESDARINARRIVAVAIAVLSLGAAGTLYVTKWEAFTVEFNGARVLTGTDLTKVGKSYFAKHPEASRAEAVAAAGGKAEDVWTIDSINVNRLDLLWYFQFAVALSVLCIILLYYSLVSGTQPTGR